MGYRKNLKIKIYPPCLEKEFFIKSSLRGLQWHSYIFPCKHIPYGVGVSDGEITLNITRYFGPRGHLPGI